MSGTGQLAVVIEPPRRDEEDREYLVGVYHTDRSVLVLSSPGTACLAPLQEKVKTAEDALGVAALFLAIVDELVDHTDSESETS